MITERETNTASRKALNCSPDSAYGYAFREGAKWAEKELEQKLAIAEEEIDTLRALAKGAGIKNKELHEEVVFLTDARDAVFRANRKLAIAKEALEYYSFPQNHVTQTVFNKELRKDIDGSGVFFCDESGKRARNALKQLSEQ